MKNALAKLPSGSFAIVMATGIVSIASEMIGMRLIAEVLFRLNIVIFLILWILLLARIVLHPNLLFSELGEFSQGSEYLTIVAGTCILGNQFLLLDRALVPAITLLSLGTLLWVILIYGAFTLCTTRAGKPPFEKEINGAWLLFVVGTQSVSVLSGMVGSEVSNSNNLLLFFSLSTFLVGCMLYVLIITPIFYRFIFYDLKPDDLSHTYWINMGAAAITTFAGVELITNAPDHPFLNGTLQFVAGFTLFFWANSTWWIPFLVLLGIWRFILHRQKLFYDLQYWSVVFPLGMYTTCTFSLSKVMKLSFLIVIPRFFIYLALLSWAILFAALLFTLIKAVLDQKLRT